MHLEVIFLNLRKKLQYLWDYYKVPLLAVPVIILTGIFLVKSFSEDTEPAFYLYFINQPVSKEGQTALTEELNLRMQLDDTTGAAYVDASLSITPANPDFDSQTAFTTAIAGHTMDVMIGDDEFFTYYAAKDAFLDLTDFLPEELYGELVPYLLTAEDADGNPHVYGLDVSSCPLSVHLKLDSPILTVAKVSEHTDLTFVFLREIFIDDRHEK